MIVVKLKSDIHPSALEVAMGHRGISQTELCKNIKGLSQPNLSKFLKRYYATISEEKLKEIMKYLDFPFEFLYKNFDTRFRFVK
jgi:predicted XRE-type DNA-binding protein